MNIKAQNTIIFIDRSILVDRPSNLLLHLLNTDLDNTAVVLSNDYYYFQQSKNHMDQCFYQFLNSLRHTQGKPLYIIDETHRNFSHVLSLLTKCLNHHHVIICTNSFNLSKKAMLLNNYDYYHHIRVYNYRRDDYLPFSLQNFRREIYG